MNLVDFIQFGPFSANYHRRLVDNSFVVSFAKFLKDALSPQIDTTPIDAEGTLVATFDTESYCHSTSLVKDIFTLDLQIFSDEGTSQIKADVTYEATQSTFMPRPGFDRNFYLWTPARKKRREDELTAIKQLIDDIRRHRLFFSICPICSGKISIIDNSALFDVFCEKDHCFKFNYHKDEEGHLLHGHFFTSHPKLY